MKSLKTTIFVALLIVLVTFAGCSTQKNTPVTRFYHNLTSKYNVLFNGTESYNKGIKKMEETFEDDYSEVLPVFIYSDPKVAQAIGSDMDRTIKKTSKLISLHSITVKPKVKSTKNLSAKEREFFNKKEFNSFVDNAYLLMGKAHFHKHEFGLATETFRLILNDFKNEPVVDETQLWLARTYNETGQYKSAEEILNLLAHKDAFPVKLLAPLYATYADYHLKQNDFNPAIKYLEKTLALKIKKNNKIRYTFILAQLYQKSGDLKKATDLYGQVIRMNPPYTMAFNARINRALTYQEGFGSAGEIEQELLKMLKDDKNLDYRDQIYYALGDLAAKEGNRQKAIEQYKKSIQYSTQNTDQKARSYLTLADLFYYLPDYINAKVYYDSAVALLEPTYKNYDLINSKSANLTRLVNEVITFTLEDSVQRLATLSEQDLLAFIDQIIENVRKEEDLNRQKEQERLLNEQFGRGMVDQGILSQVDQTTSARWYFYNDAAKNLGYKEFKLKWGNRKLEDHWQRQNKAMAVFTSGTENGETEPGEVVQDKQLSNKTREYYLQHVPRNDSMMQASHKRAENALYNMGIIYKNELKDYDKAKESFKELLKRYPLSEHRLSAYYNLYIMAREESDQALMYSYQQKIVAEFPESAYAKILNNPNYLKEIESEEKKIIRQYEETYDLFKMGNYPAVITRASDAMESYPEDPLIPQFDYLRVLALGKTSDTKAFRSKLNDIVEKYPGTEVSDASQNILAYMNKEHPELLEEEEKIIAEKLYEYIENTRHNVAFVTSKKSNNNQLTFNIINFNLDNFDAENLRIETVEINAMQSLLLIKSFRSKTESVDYLNLIRSDEKVLRDYDDPSVQIMTISDENLRILLEDKSTDRYLKFYLEHY
ncbi:MAG: tetratricopeptide repeat protein [Bacteroidales bacterium]|nr:tetratricopeptide repeat protein [Bacteroidales bacterium]